VNQLLKPMEKMSWLDLYNYLHAQAHDFKNMGKFPWREEVKIFDWETLEYYSTNFIQTPDDKISLSIDTHQLENINGS